MRIKDIFVEITKYSDFIPMTLASSSERLAYANLDITENSYNLDMN